MQGLKMQPCQLPLGIGHQFLPRPVWVSLPTTFPSARGKAQGGRQAVQSQLPWREPSFTLWAGCAGLLGGEWEGRMCLAEARYSLPRPPAPAIRAMHPGPSVRGWRSGISRMLPQYPSPRYILHCLLAQGLCFLPGEALKAAWAGAPGRSPTRREAKSARGPPGRPSHADAGGLCQHPLAYLPPQWLFAFGEALAGWGLGRPERRSLGGGSALSGHLLQLLAVTGHREAQGGRGRQKTPMAQLRLVRES